MAIGKATLVLACFLVLLHTGIHATSSLALEITQHSSIRLPHVSTDGVQLEALNTASCEKRVVLVSMRGNLLNASSLSATGACTLLVAQQQQTCTEIHVIHPRLACMVLAPAAGVLSVPHGTAGPDSTSQLQTQAALSADETWDLQLQTLAAKAHHWGFTTTLQQSDAVSVSNCVRNRPTLGQEAKEVTPAAASQSAVAAAEQSVNLQEQLQSTRLLVLDECQASPRDLKVLALLSGRTVHVRKGLPCSPQAPAPDHSLHASTASSQPQPPLATFQTHADTDARLDILSEASSVEYTLAQGEGGKALGEQPLSPFVESVGSDGRSLKGMVDRDEPRNRRQAVRRNRGRTGRGGAEETAHNAVAAADGLVRTSSKHKRQRRPEDTFDSRNGDGKRGGGQRILTQDQTLDTNTVASATLDSREAEDSSNTARQLLQLARGLYGDAGSEDGRSGGKMKRRQAGLSGGGGGKQRGEMVEGGEGRGRVGAAGGKRRRRKREREEDEQPNVEEGRADARGSGRAGGGRERGKEDGMGRRGGVESEEVFSSGLFGARNGGGSMQQLGKRRHQKAGKRIVEDRRRSLASIATPQPDTSDSDAHPLGEAEALAGPGTPQLRRSLREVQQTEASALHERRLVQYGETEAGNHAASSGGRDGLEDQEGGPIRTHIGKRRRRRRKAHHPEVTSEDAQRVESDESAASGRDGGSKLKKHSMLGEGGKGQRQHRGDVDLSKSVLGVKGKGRAGAGGKKGSMLEGGEGNDTSWEARQQDAVRSTVVRSRKQGQAENSGGKARNAGAVIGGKVFAKGGKSSASNLGTKRDNKFTAAYAGYDERRRLRQADDASEVVAGASGSSSDGRGITESQGASVTGGVATSAAVSASTASEGTAAAAQNKAVEVTAAQILQELEQYRDTEVLYLARSVTVILPSLEPCSQPAA